MLNLGWGFSDDWGFLMIIGNQGKGLGGVWNGGFETYPVYHDRPPTVWTFKKARFPTSLFYP